MAVVSGATGAALAKQWWSGPAAVGVGAGILGALELITEGLRSLRERRVVWSGRLEEARGPSLPLVMDVADLAAWRVGHVDRHGRRHYCPYVPRDLDDGLRRALGPGRFVLVVGESAAGTTRTAAEAVRATLSDHTWIAPKDAEDMEIASQAAGDHRRCVLWLDDVDRFLGHRGLSRELAEQILSGESAVIVATINSVALHDYESETDNRLTGMDRHHHRDARDVLAMATRMRLDRRWSAAEVERARRHGQDRHLADAVRAAATHGIAETLTCGPQLLELWRGAWCAGRNPRGAALVTAVVDCRRAGLRGPVPLGLARGLHVEYLEERGGNRLAPETFDRALEWACSRVRASACLLTREGDPPGLVPFAHLQYATGLEPVPGHLWEGLLAQAGDGERWYSVGIAAHRELHFGCADQALRRAVDQGRAGASFALARVVGDAGRPSEALAMLRESRTTAGVDDLILREQSAHFHGVAGQLDTAVRLFGELVRDMRSQLSADHPDTMAARHQLAYYKGESGDPRAAVEELTALVRDRGRIDGAEHPQTFAARRSLAWAIGRAGDLDKAIADLRKLLDEENPLRGVHDPHLLATQAALAWFRGEAGDWRAAVDGLTPVWQGRVQVLGRDHPHTLATRLQLARATARRGDVDEAAESLLVLLADMRRILEHAHPHRRAAAALLRELTGG
ncbi:tetratricopeptide repeat protein [Streptomyces sp. NPDC059009]|uniref:tetratricopeptide repeat protein n=1 Tax=Streptomyces sp. NPDC059009 TaxID=3346694 RepID=UPI00369E3F75